MKKKSNKKITKKIFKCQRALLEAYYKASHQMLFKQNFRCDNVANSIPQTVLFQTRDVFLCSFITVQYQHR
jgi:hypothetical protein